MTRPLTANQTWVLRSLLIEPGHAYALAARLDLPRSTVRKALAALERRGYAESSWEFAASPSGGPPRRAYMITAAGGGVTRVEN